MRYERERSGELVHDDTNELGKIGHRTHDDRNRKTCGVGWELLPVAVDDKTGMAYAEVLPDERGVTARA